MADPAPAKPALAEQASANTTPFRVVAWNIRAGGGKRAELIAQTLIDWQPDAVVLSEFRGTPASQQIAAALADAGLEQQIATTGQVPASANALLIAARTSLRKVALQRRPTEPGRWLMVRLPGYQMCIGGMHIPNQHTGRKPAFHDAILDLARRWRGGPTLLVGDTNSGRIHVDEERPVFNRRTHDWFDHLSAAGWQDAFRMLHGARREFTWYSPGHDNGFRLDQALANRPLQRCLTAVQHQWGVDPQQPDRRDAVSDHAALIVDFAC